MRRNLVPLLLLTGLAACQPSANGGDDDGPKIPDVEKTGKADSSAIATVLTFEFDGELVASATWSGTQALIQDQLLYTIGHLNGSRAVGRLDKVTLTNIKSAPATGGTRVSYHASLPVAWGAKSNLPTSYALTLPLVVDSAAQEAFTAKYKAACVDAGAHDVDADSMWYYYRPNNSGCHLDAADVTKTTARVTVSPTNTNGKYPEYDKVWADGQLRVVSIFGKYEDGATSTGDAGIAAYNEFLADVRALLAPYGVTTVPASVPSNPGVSLTDVQFSATIAPGKTVVVNALLVDAISTAPPSFDARYAQLTPRADLIAYNGHAGLGQNVRALARKGSWVAGQYLMMFSNGCDTFAYVDGYLAQARASLNPGDASGSKYLDFIVNAMPAFFASDSNATMAIVRGLMKYDAPLTYQQIFNNIDASQVVLVTGEEDNTYTPSTSGGGVFFTGLHETGSVAAGEEMAYETPTVPAGAYLVKLAESPAGGDADLYVKAGAAPTTTAYDCRPYTSGSNEECRVTLTAPGKIFVAVRGYASQESGFALTVDPLNASAPGFSFDKSGAVTKGQAASFATDALPAGKYKFTMTGATGDADLYLKVGAAPTTSSYDCRPYKSGSNEECLATLTTAQPVFLMVRGYAAASSDFHLVGVAQ